MSGASSIAEIIAGTPMARPDAPYSLTDEQARVWRSVVDRMPSDWFPSETHQLLAQYCRHCVDADRIAMLIEQTLRPKRIDIELYVELLKAQDREGRALSSLATRMRLSQQATYAPSKSKGRRTEAKPWEAGWTPPAKLSK